MLATICSDGASTLMGSKTGVNVRWRKLMRLLIILHCGNHKGSLACAGAGDSQPYLRNFFEILDKIARFYADSAKRTSGLVAHQYALLNKSIKLVRNAFTRWLTHDAVTESL